MKDPLRVRLSGPLQEFGPAFVVELERQGYLLLGATLQMRLMVRVSSWMQAEGLACGELSDEVVERFLAERRAAGHRDYVTARAIAPLLGYLRELGVVPSASPTCPSTRAEMLGGRFRVYLTVERGLAEETATGYVDAVKPFLAGLDDEQLDLRDLSAGRVTAFVVARCPGQSRGSAKMTVTALRSLLGFLHVEGLIARSLLGAVPSAASWRLSGLPRFLEDDQAQALLDSCDPQTVTGRRDLAILTLLVRLGLRAGEVAGLRLEDLDWRAGELVIGKGRRSERLPLPVDVGEAITGYLRDGRPGSALEAHAGEHESLRVDDRVRPSQLAERQALAKRGDVPALDRCRNARGRAAVPPNHRPQGSRQARSHSRTRDRPAHHHTRIRGGRYARHRLNITPGPSPKFHADRDILRPVGVARYTPTPTLAEQVPAELHNQLPELAEISAGVQLIVERHADEVAEAEASHGEA
jgi:integrase/recombinase XerD